MGDPTVMIDGLQMENDKYTLSQLFNNVCGDCGGTGECVCDSELEKNISFWNPRNGYKYITINGEVVSENDLPF